MRGKRSPSWRQRASIYSSANDLLSGWPPTLDSALRTRLDADWGIVSRHVVHFSRLRVLDASGRVELPRADRAALKRIADDVLAVWDLYAAASNHQLAPHRAQFPRRFDHDMPGSPPNLLRLLGGQVFRIETLPRRMLRRFAECLLRR